jgi:pimeloyl-ACP methyl ester carboxylesterase
MIGIIGRNRTFRIAHWVWVGALLITGAFFVLPVRAASALSFAPCASGPGFSCSSLPVPLDRSGQVQGTISLEIGRKQAGELPSNDAVLALAGGPGQAALPLAGQFAKVMAPALGKRDLVTFDQRGTGISDPVRCPALSSEETAEEVAFLETVEAVGVLVELCALQIGPARAAFTTQESAADIESIRRALGYEKLVLYGTSYGTKVALQYAERYPQHVEALVLDSVVLSNGPEPFGVSTAKAIGPALSDLCSKRACAGITQNPLRDLARLVTRLRKHAMKGVVYDGSGHPVSSELGAGDLLPILEAGDLNPALRALTPGAVRSALGGEANPLLRLVYIAVGVIPTTPRPPSPPEESVDSALYLDTRCEETLFPWQRSNSASNRRKEALAVLHAFPRSAFYPFDSSIAWNASLIPACVHWPDASAPPPTPGALPDMPTLILSGAQDLRTPTSNARYIAAQIPGSQLVVVPHTGHGVIGSDFSGCARAAILAFFDGGAVKPCVPAKNPLPPTPTPPDKLADVPPFPGIRGRAGRTVTAVLDTLLDFNQELDATTFQRRADLPVGSRFGGLSGGSQRVTSSGYRLVRFTVIPGVTLSGTFRLKNGKELTTTLVISGKAAAHGTLRINATRVSGRLEGIGFDVARAKARLTRARATEATWLSVPSNLTVSDLARLH